MEGKPKKSARFAVDINDIIEEISNLDLTSKREKTLGTKKGTPPKKTLKLSGTKRNFEESEESEDTKDDHKKHKSSSIKRRIYKRKSRKLLKSLKKRSKSRVRKFKNKSKSKKRSLTKKFR